MAGERTNLMNIIIGYESQIENTNDPAEIEKLDFLLANEKSKLKIIDNSFSDNREKMIALTESAFKKLEIYNNTFEKLELIKPFNPKNSDEFKEKKKAKDFAETEYNEVINKLAPLIPTTNDWYVLEELNKEVLKINEFDVKIKPY